MRTHEEPPLEQPEWDMFLIDAKSKIDDRIAPRPAVRTRQRLSRRAQSIIAVSGVALGAVLVLGNREAPDDAVAIIPDVAVAQGPASDGTPRPFRAAKGAYTTASQVLTAASVSSASRTSNVSDAPYWRVESDWKQVSSSGIPEESDSGKRIIWQGRINSSVLFQDGLLRKLPPASFSMQQTSFSWDELDDLTTSPRELATLLKTQTVGLQGDPNQYAFKFIGELLSESPASPELRSALWEVAADLNGMTLNGEAQDAIGRDGWSITVGDLTYIVEPQTGSILETHFENETVSYTSTNISAEPADTAPKSVDDVRPAT